MLPMARYYATVFGILAAAVAIARGFLYDSEMQSTITVAITYAILFAMIGAGLGQLADWIVNGSRLHAKKE
jgi:hypothetical protein